MSVTVKFRCDGCFVEADEQSRIRKEFRSFSGKGHGFGIYVTQNIEDIAPEGWVPFDPYTQCCYCPDCWAEIEAETRTEVV